MLNTAELIALLSQNAAVLREDIALIEAGAIKFTVHDAAVNQEQVGRLKANLERIEQVIACLEFSPS